MCTSTNLHDCKYTEYAHHSSGVGLSMTFDQLCIHLRTHPLSDITSAPISTASQLHLGIVAGVPWWNSDPAAVLSTNNMFRTNNRYCIRELQSNLWPPRVHSTLPVLPYGSFPLYIAFVHLNRASSPPIAVGAGHLMHSKSCPLLLHHPEHFCPKPHGARHLGLCINAPALQHDLLGQMFT